MSFQPGANLYTQGFGSRPEGVEVAHIERRDPSPTDVNYPISKRWINTVSEHEFILYSFSVVNGVTQANWGSPVGVTGAVISLGDNSNVQTFPNSSGSIQLTGVANQISVTSNPSTHQIQFGITNPLNIGALSASGAVNLATATDLPVNIGNPASLSQTNNINGNQVNIQPSGTGQFVVGNSLISFKLVQVSYSSCKWSASRRKFDL